MRLVFLTLLLVAPGCVANHRIRLKSDPSGVYIEMNGEYIGQTPMDYILVSPYADTIWPKEVKFVGRNGDRGWKPAVKHFKARSRLPGTIYFLLEPDHSKAARRRSRFLDRSP